MSSLIILYKAIQKQQTPDSPYSTTGRKLSGGCMLYELSGRSRKPSKSAK